MEYEELSPELKAKAHACKTPEEVLELAKSVGVTLTDEQLDDISGGSSWGGKTTTYIIAHCGHCGAEIKFEEGVPGLYQCPDCGIGFARVDENGDVYLGSKGV